MKKKILTLLFTASSAIMMCGKSFSQELKIEKEGSYTIKEGKVYRLDENMLSAKKSLLQEVESKNYDIISGESGFLIANNLLFARKWKDGDGLLWFDKNKCKNKEIKVKFTDKTLSNLNSVSCSDSGEEWVEIFLSENELDDLVRKINNNKKLNFANIEVIKSSFEKAGFTLDKKDVETILLEQNILKFVLKALKNIDSEKIYLLNKSSDKRTTELYFLEEKIAIIFDGDSVVLRKTSDQTANVNGQNKHIEETYEIAIKDFKNKIIKALIEIEEKLQENNINNINKTIIEALGRK